MKKKVPAIFLDLCIKYDTLILEIERIMLNYYENFLVYKGEYFSIYFHAETKDSSVVSDYFERCDDVTQASLLFLAKTMGDMGRIYNEAKFRSEDKQNKIYCLNQEMSAFSVSFLQVRK